VEGHELERRYGLSEQSAPSWLSDYVKQQLLGTAVTMVLSGFLAAVIRKWPRTWPYYAAAATFPLLLLANIVIPIYVLPLFNTYVPLTGELEKRLRALASRYGVGDAEILRVDMSKQTTKANAFVIGIGKTHRIVVGDTLIEHFTPEEIEFVVAHELGHYVSRDTWRLMAAGQLAAMAAIFGAYAALGNVSSEDLRRPRLPAKVQFVAMAIAQILRPPLSAFSRSREWAADRFAVAATNEPATGASAFRRLRDQNLAEDEQPAWFEFMFSTHPPLKARIAALENAT
ncbi:MAG TPA: M48 family metalloprotease, partial [Candidatus Baltobacteraceae bacterium]|nr:M48 family metalloprotease [Candidatus Baltobacteraceae bacterium]